MSQKLRPCVRLKRRHLPERVLQATGVLQAAETHLPGVRRALLHRWVCARKYAVLTQWKRELTLSGWLTDWEWGFVRKVNYNGSFTDIELRGHQSGYEGFRRLRRHLRESFSCRLILRVVASSFEHRLHSSSFCSITHDVMAFLKQHRGNYEEKLSRNNLIYNLMIYTPS